jgi:hypothetical protein
MQPYREALFRCYLDYVAGLDDGISDARTIAGALSRVCWTQQQASFEIYRRYLTPVAMAMFIENMQASAPDLALPFVLNYRRQKQQQQR